MAAFKRPNLAQPFTDLSARLNIEADLELIDHFDEQLLSYARLVKCAHGSAGKRLGSGGKKFGNAHLYNAPRRTGFEHDVLSSRRHGSSWDSKAAAAGR